MPENFIHNPESRIPSLSTAAELKTLAEAARANRVRMAIGPSCIEVIPLDSDTGVQVERLLTEGLRGLSSAFEVAERFLTEEAEKLAEESEQQRDEADGLRKALAGAPEGDAPDSQAAAKIDRTLRRAHISKSEAETTKRQAMACRAFVAAAAPLLR